MNYIVDMPEGGWDLTGYFNHLEKIRESFPSEAYSFAADVRNYDLESHQSLHDAWLESILISEDASGPRSEVRAIKIDCRFLGPYHDLLIHLTYFGVTEYNLTSPFGVKSPPSSVGHGDLLMHEMRLNERGEIIHEMNFSRGSRFSISCDRFMHRVEMRG